MPSKSDAYLLLDCLERTMSRTDAIKEFRDEFGLSLVQSLDWVEGYSHEKGFTWGEGAVEVCSWCGEEHEGGPEECDAELCEMCGRSQTRGWHTTNGCSEDDVDD